MTMSVWEQRTSQLRRHRQMSSREILYTSPSEERDGPAQAQQGHPLSLHQKVMQHTPSSSIKRLNDPLASPAKNQDSSFPVDTPLDAALSTDIPEPPVVPEVSMTIPEPPETEPIPENEKLRLNSTIHERKGRLNGERQHKPVKKFRPPDNIDALTPEMGVHRFRGRRSPHQCDLQMEARSRGSSPGNQSKNMTTRSVSQERMKNSEEAEEKEPDKTEQRKGETGLPEENRYRDHH